LPQALPNASPALNPRPTHRADLLTEFGPGEEMADLSRVLQLWLWYYMVPCFCQTADEEGFSTDNCGSHASVSEVGRSGGSDGEGAPSQPQAARVLAGKDHMLLQRSSGQVRKNIEHNAMGRDQQECSTTIEGEQCFTAVVWAKTHGIVQHPEWYPSYLSAASSLEEFQAHFNNISYGGCAPPCELCHSAEPGEVCHEVVEWAMYNGINAYPELFPGLRVGSSAEEFQQAIHDNNRIAYLKDPHISVPSDCRNYMAAHGCDWALTEGCPNTTSGEDTPQGYHCCCELELRERVCPEPCRLCRTVSEGDQCFSDVMWAMEIGIKQHPEWYPNLTDISTIEDFQDYLRTLMPCPPPCSRCQSATPGERCYDGVMWAMEHGIINHPEWYPELSQHSRFDDFQHHLHQGGYEGCPLPCVVIGEGMSVD